MSLENRISTELITDKTNHILGTLLRLILERCLLAYQFPFINYTYCQYGHVQLDTLIILDWKQTNAVLNVVISLMISCVVRMNTE